MEDKLTELFNRIRGLRNSKDKIISKEEQARNLIKVLTKIEGQLTIIENNILSIWDKAAKVPSLYNDHILESAALKLQHIDSLRTKIHKAKLELSFYFY